MSGRNKYLEDDSESDYTSSDDELDIHEIVRTGTYTDVKEAIARDRPRLIALKDKHGRIPIHYAALMDRMKVAVFLIAKKSDYDAKDKQEQTPLHLAASSGLTNMCRTLLEFHANIKLRDKQCWTALHHAVNGHYYDTSTLLVKRGADIDAEDYKHGRTVLHIAAEKGYADLVDMLIVRGASMTASGDHFYSKTPLHLACLHGHTECVKALVRRGAQLNALSGFLDLTALHMACEQGHADCVKILLDSGVDLNMTGNHINGSTALHICAQHNQLQCLELLIDYGADATQLGRFTTVGSPLHTACQYGHAHAAHVLVSRAGVDINIREDTALTPLHIACRHERYDVAFMLIMIEADCKCKADNGKTAFDYVTVPTIKEKMRKAAEEVAQKIARQVAAEIAAKEVKENLLFAREEALQRAVMKAEAERRYKEIRLSEFLALLRAAADISGEVTAFLAIAEEFPEQDINTRLYDINDAATEAGLMDEQSVTSSVTSSYYSRGVAKRPPWRPGMDLSLVGDEGGADGDSSRIAYSIEKGVVVPSYDPHAQVYGDKPNYALVPNDDISEDVGTEQEYYCMALTRAAFRGFDEAVHVLLHWPSVDINAREANGNTALHNAALMGHREIVEELILAGAKNSIMNNQGRAAANVAKTDYIREMIRNPAIITTKLQHQDDVLRHLFLRFKTQKQGNDAPTMSDLQIAESVLAPRNVSNRDHVSAAIISNYGGLLDTNVLSAAAVVAVAPMGEGGGQGVFSNSSVLVPFNGSVSAGAEGVPHVIGAIPPHQQTFLPRDPALDKYGPVPSDFGGSLADMFFEPSDKNTDSNNNNKNTDSNNNNSNRNLSSSSVGGGEEGDAFIDLLTLQKGYLPTAFDSTEEWCEVKDFLWLVGYEEYKKLSSSSSSSTVVNNGPSPELASQSKNNDHDSAAAYDAAAYDVATAAADGSALRDRRPLLHQLSLVMDLLQQIFTSTETRTAQLYSLQLIEPASLASVPSTTTNAAAAAAGTGQPDATERTSQVGGVKLPALSPSKSSQNHRQSNKQDSSRQSGENKHVAHIKEALSSLHATIDAGAAPQPAQQDQGNIAAAIPQSFAAALESEELAQQEIEQAVRRDLKASIDWKRIPANIKPEDIWRLVAFALKCDAFVEHVLQVLEPDYYGWPTECYNWRESLDFASPQVTRSSSNASSGTDLNSARSLNAANIAGLGSINKIKINYLHQYALISADMQDHLLNLVDLGFSECFAKRPSSTGNNTCGNTYDNAYDNNTTTVCEADKSAQEGRAAGNAEMDEDGDAIADWVPSKKNRARHRRKIPDLFVNPPRYWRVAVDAIYEVAQFVKAKTEATYPADAVRASLWGISGRNIIRQKQTVIAQQEANYGAPLPSQPHHLSLQLQQQQQQQQPKSTALQLWLQELLLLHYEPYFHHQGFRLLRDFVGLSEQDCLEFFSFLKAGDMRRVCRTVPKLTDKDVTAYENQSSGKQVKNKSNKKKKKKNSKPVSTLPVDDGDVAVIDT